jgi:predicted SprT family Zn-dependent metalloprotease
MDKFAKYIQRKQNSLPHYLTKYDIDTKPNNIELTRKEVLERIHHYEMKHLIELVNQGIDPKTKEIGYFIQS